MNTKRPFTQATIAGTAAHHSFELASGVGLVWQPELGLSKAGALWAVQLAGWRVLATRSTHTADPILAVLAGSSLAGVATHFVLWPTRRGPGGLPILAEAEGLTEHQLPAYNAILWAWALAATASLFELSPKSRRWALLGLGTLPVFKASAQHHFSWVTQQAKTNPQWWNRAVREASDTSAVS